jgi:hypothetical protein
MFNQRELIVDFEVSVKNTMGGDYWRNHSLHGLGVAELA